MIILFVVVVIAAVVVRLVLAIAQIPEGRRAPARHHQAPDHQQIRRGGELR